MPLFSLFISVVFLYVWFGDIRKSWRFKQSFWQSYAVRFTAKILLFAPLIIVLVNFVLPRYGGISGENAVLPFSLLLSAAISYTWITYLRWIDVFEPERKRYLFLVFALSCLTILLVFPISNAIHTLGFNLNDAPVNDFLYCFAGIGMVEEFVKLLPLLFIILFTKQINEPLDYIVYAAMSALGFAFVENVLYLQSTNLTALTGRLLYASVAHMFFAACIAYPLAIARLKTGKRLEPKALIIGFLLAALTHGFYDFWLINTKLNLPIVTTIFFLGSLHVFTLMKNNLINMSDFYTDTVRIVRSKLKYDLIWYILLVIYSGYFFFALLYGSAAANKLLLSSAIFHVSTVIYIALTFSSLNVIKGYSMPLRFPLKVFLPKIDGATDFTGTTLKIYVVKPNPFKKPVLTDEVIEGILKNRVVVEDDMNWYFLRDELSQRAFLMKPKAISDGFSKETPSKVVLAELKNALDLPKVIYTKKDILRAMHGVAKEIIQTDSKQVVL